MELSATLYIVMLSTWMVLLIPQDCAARRLKLFNMLLDKNRYNKMIRPTPSRGQATIVHLGLRLAQIVDVDERKEVITTKVWVEQEWVDGRLMWDPAEFGETDMVLMPAERIWKPDIVLYNNADGKYEITTLTKAMVFYNGTVIWMPPALYMSSCRINVEFFPYDEQVCSMRFGSWTYDGRNVDLRHHLQTYVPELKRPIYIDYAVDLYQFNNTVEFNIIAVSAMCQDRFYKYSHNSYPEITFRLRMRRRTIFYTFNLMLPCVAISILTVLTFYLPPESKEKISLSINIFLSLTLFFLLISETIPPTSLAVPLIGKYLLFTMLLITSSIIVTVVVLNLQFRSSETHFMSSFIRTVFLEVLPKFMWLNPPRRDSTTQSRGQRTSNFSVPLHRNSVNPSATTASSISKLKSHATIGNPIHLIPLKTERQAKRETKKEIQKDSLVEALLEEISKHSARVQARITGKLDQMSVGASYIAQQFKDFEVDSDVKEDWQFIAVVVDRLCLCIFTIVCVICTLSIIFQSPAIVNLQEPINTEQLPTIVNLTSYSDAEMTQPILTESILLPSY